MKSNRFIFSGVLVALAAAHAEAQVVACDLIEQSTVTSVFSSPITQQFPNRQTQPVDGAVHSACVFHTARNNLKALLFEFPSEVEASRAFSRYTANGQQAIFQAEAGLGDAAMWWRIGNEAYGYTVRKGKRVFTLDTRWHDTNNSVGQKERLRPVVASALRKL